MKTTKTAVLLCALGAALCVSSTAQAQYRSRPVRERVIRIERVNPLRETIDRAERRSNDLRHEYEHNYGRYMRDDDRRNRLGDDAKRSIQRMDEALERLRRAADQGRARSDREDARAAIDNARDVDRIFSMRPRLRDVVGDRWRDLRADLDDIAEQYGLPRIGRR